ncbi:hypothetical protein C8R43DRAFT_1125383 [Mycena crocata]|nr:hypothetical protein C8R43DRAFT_1125383 [Mycena crocata]
MQYATYVFFALLVACGAHARDRPVSNTVIRTSRDVAGMSANNATAPAPSRPNGTINVDKDSCGCNTQDSYQSFLDNLYQVWSDGQDAKDAKDAGSVSFGDASNTTAPATAAPAAAVGTNGTDAGGAPAAGGAGTTTAPGAAS